MSSDEIISSDAPLTALQRSTLRRILRAMIPSSDSHQVPGADDPAIVADILATGQGQLPMMTPALDALHGQFDNNDESVAPDRPIEAQDSAIEWFRAQHPEIAGLLVALTLQCYYRDDRVMASLEMEPRPPFPQGYPLSDGDWSLLDPVRVRGPIYRPIKEN
jgi:hypothetical protein